MGRNASHSRFARFLVGVSLLFWSACAGGSSDPSVNAEVATWIRSHAARLEDQEAAFEKIDSIVRDALVIGFGEPDHGFREFAEFRNALVEHLVRTHDVRAITLETGILEARVVDRYVTDVRGDSGLVLDDVMREGFTHRMGEFEEARALVTWVKEFNQEAALAGRPLVHWGGKDLSVRGDTLTVPLALAKPYFERVGAGERLARLDALAVKAAAVVDFVEQTLREKVGADHIDPDHLDAVCSLGYDQLGDAEHAEIGAEIEAVLAFMEDHRAEWIGTTGEDDFDWAQRTIVVAQQMWQDLESRNTHGVMYGRTNGGDTSLEYLERVYSAGRRPLPPMPHVQITDRDYTTAELATYLAGRESREEHLADNVAYLAQRYGKTFDFAATAHLDRARGLEDSGSSAGEGYFLARRFMDRYVVIAGTAGRFVDPDRELTTLRDEQSRRSPSFEAQLAAAGIDSFVLGIEPPLRMPPPSGVLSWLVAPQLTWIGPVKFQVVPTDSYDAVVWFDEVHPARRTYFLGGPVR